jgi:spore germination protein KC
MRSKTAICCLLICLLVPLEGCWDFQRLRDREVVLGISVDNQNEGYSIALETIRFASSQGENKPSPGNSLLIHSTFPRKSIELPLHLVQSHMSGHPFYSNLRILAIGKEQAKLGIADLISHFVRDPDMRRTTDVVIAEQSAGKLLGIKTKHENFTSTYLEMTVKGMEEGGHTLTSDIGEISRSIHEHRDSLIPLVKPLPSNEEAEVIGVVVLDEQGKWLDQLSMKEAEAVALVRKPAVIEGSQNMQCPQTGEGSVTMDVVKAKSTLKPLILDSKLVIRGETTLRGYVAEYTCSDENIRHTTALKQLEKQFEDKIGKEVNARLESVMHRSGADVLDVRSRLQRNPQQWNKLADQFDDLARNAKSEIHIHVKLKAKGAES